MSLGVWAEARDAPGSICWDARLRGMKDETRDATYGQAGWHVGVGFVTLGDLVSRLAGMKLPHFTCGNYVFDCPPLHDYQIRRLAIHCHGVEGKLYVNGKQQLPMSLQNLSRFADDLEKIGKLVMSHGTILFMGCLAGGGIRGSDLLIALSEIWKNRKVVGFATIGFSSGGNQLRPGRGCTEPGMRDTQNTSGALNAKQLDRDYGPIWDDLTELPWASETSRHAKVAQNGKIIHGKNLTW